MFYSPKYWLVVEVQNVRPVSFPIYSDRNVFYILCVFDGIVKTHKEKTFTKVIHTAIKKAEL